MTEEERIDLLIDTMAAIYEIEAKVKEVSKALEVLSADMYQNSRKT